MNAGLTHKNSKKHDAQTMLYSPKKYARACNFLLKQLNQVQFL